MLFRSGIFCDDYENSVMSFIRRGKKERDFLVFVCNFTPVVRKSYVLGVPEKCYYKEIFNSDSELYGGSNMGNFAGAYPCETSLHQKPYSIEITLPPLACVILRPQFD